MSEILSLDDCQNLHEIHPGQCYRSAQLSRQGLENVVRKFGIKTIINLRGEQLDCPMYRDEVAVCQENNIKLVNIDWRVKQIPSATSLNKLLSAFERCSAPFLIHCQVGVDRTGLACAIYQYEKQGMNKEEAGLQLGEVYASFIYEQSADISKVYFFMEVYQGKEWARYKYNPSVQHYLYN